ncbi:MAG: HDOD domain-containing protein [Spirochaetia bacterium]|nr:HDOD domain-containing protein [Spirochaetia bacterium]
MAVPAEYLVKIKDLTIMPPVLLSVLHLSDDNDLDFRSLERMVQSDQILVSRMLHLANSPFYSRGNRIQSIQQTITRLGFKTVRSMIALALSDSIFMSGNYNKFKQEVWHHSIATGIVAQLLCNDLSLKKEQDVALIGGLLQNLGKIVLNTLDRTKYIQVLTRFLESEHDVRDIERELFGVDNVEMGTAAGMQWKLPEEIIEVIRCQSDDLSAQPLKVQLVTFANLIARKAGHGRFDAGSTAKYEEYMDHFKIAAGDRPKLHTQYEDRLIQDELYKFCSVL